MDVKLSVRREGMRKVFIRYRDAKGVASDRVITPLALQGYFNDDMVLIVEKVDARCESARAKRTFLARRIEHLADFETGEVLDIGAWVAGLPTDDAEMDQAVRMQRQMAALTRGAEQDERRREMLAELGEMQRENRMGLWRAIGCAVLLVVFAVFAVVAISR